MSWRDKLRRFWLELVKKQCFQIVPSLLEAICSGQLDTEENVSSERIFAKNFAKLLDMAIRFDCLKVGTPTLQNGFSLFRRMCLLKSFGDSQPLLYAHVGDQIALFLSRCTPLFTSIVNGAERFIGRQLSRELALSHLTEAILVIYNVNLNENGGGNDAKFRFYGTLCRDEAN